MRNPDMKSVKPQPLIFPPEGRIAGFTAGYANAGQKCLIEVCGLHTFDEGLSFYNMLEAFDPYIQKAGLIQSTIDHILVVISPKETYVYINDNLPIIFRGRIKRSCNAGEVIFRDDLAAIDKIDFPNIQIPRQSGIMLLLSVGWRRGMCVDFRA